MHSSKNEQIISQLLYFLSVELRAGTAAVHKTSTGKSVTYQNFRARLKLNKKNPSGTLHPERIAD